jgi:low affinity Fe/Cu permease
LAEQHASRFDAFADVVERGVSRGWFFAVCVLIVVLWLPSYFITGDVNTWQLIINTLTTVITFLLVALLQNTQARFEDAVNARLEEILDKLDGAADPVDDPGNKSTVAG